MSFYDHLCSHQNVCLSFGECRENLLMIFFLSGCICIHTKNFCLWKELLYLFFDLLGSRPKSANIRRTAYRAILYIRNGISTVMTDQLSIFVRSKGDIAMGTFHHMTAGSAADKSSISSSVQKQNYLFFPVQTFFHLFL